MELGCEMRKKAGEKGTRGEREKTFPDPRIERADGSRAAEVERRREVTGKKAGAGSQLHLTSPQSTIRFQVSS